MPGFGGVVKLTGETEYMRSLKAITQQLKVLTSEMKIVEATYGKNNQSIEALNAKQDVLNKRLKEQTKNYESAKSTLASLTDQQEKNDKIQGDLILKHEQAKAKLDELRNSTSATTNQIRNAEAEVSRYGFAIAQNTETQTENIVTLKKVEAEMNKAKADIVGITREMENNEKAIKQGESAYSKLTSTISSQESQLEKLKKEYVNVVLEQGKGSKEAKDLLGQIKGLNSELQENQSKLNGATDELKKFEKVEEDAGKGAFSLGDLIKANVISELIMSGLNKLGELMTNCARKTLDFVKESVAVGASFEAGMSQVSAISGATGSDLDMLTSKAQEMGAKTKFTATESAEAFKYMAIAGWETTEMMDGIDGVMNLAAASGEDLGRVSDIVTDNITALGLSSKDTNDFVDLLARTVTGSNTTVEELGESFKYCSTIAGSLGYEAKDVSLALGLMADSGLKGSQAGTALRSMMSRLAADTNGARSTLEEMGVQVVNEDGSMRALGEVINDIRPAFDKLSDSQKAETAEIIAGKTGMAGLLAVANSSPDTFAKVTAALDNTAVTAGTMANTMIDNVEGAQTILKSSLEGFQITLFQNISEPLKQVTLDAAGSLNNLNTAFKEGGINGLSDQLGVELSNWVNKITEFLPSIAEQGTKIILNLLSGIQSQMSSMGPCIGQVITTLTSGLLDMLPQILQIGMDLIVQLALGIAKSLPELIPKAVECIMTLVETLLDHIDEVLDAALKIIIALADGLIKALPNLVEKLPVIIEKLVFRLIELSPQLWSAALQIMIKLALGLIEYVPEMISRIPKIITSLVNGFKDHWDKMKNIGMDLLKGVWEGISSWASNLKKKVSDLCGNIVGWFKNALGIHSPSTVFADAIGKNIGKGIEVGYEKEIESFGDVIQNSIPTDYDFNMNANTNIPKPRESTSTNFNTMVSAFKQALSEMKVEMDGEEMGSFVDSTVTKLIYAY